MAPDTITDEDLMLSPADVVGDSSLARARANTILDAQKKVKDELAKAKAALAELEKFKAEADEEQLIATIDLQIELAKRRIKTIEDLLANGGKLANAVMKVTGSEAEPKDADDKAAEVAKAVEDATRFRLGGGIFTGENADKYPDGKTYDRSNVNTWVAYSYSVSSIPADIRGLDLRLLDRRPTKGLVMRHNAESNTKSFKEIFGDDKVMLATTGISAATPIYLASLEGMDAEDQAGNLVRARGPASAAVGTYRWMGIDGRLLCRGVPRCLVTNDKLGAGWYWAAPNGREYVRWEMEGKEYKAYFDYANYGYWLRIPTEGDKAGTITEVITFGIPASGAPTNGKLTADNDLGNKATYTGEAIGISVLTDDDGDAMDSGQFTADVTLNASFGASPTVTGTIDGFEGNAVNEDWEVTLESTTLRTGVPPAPSSGGFGLTTAEGDYQPDDVGGTKAQGRWHARAYGGSSDKRPTGITGDFTALFTNGRAVGGYGTRLPKDEE